jgi:hypothetical protein
MHELISNLHIHTTYSDGSASHLEVAKEALEAGLDVILTTDHNVLVREMEGYHNAGENRLLVLVGEEIHDRTRHPQNSHLLVFGAGKELSNFATDTQNLVRMVHQAGGISFVAHPYESELPAFKEPSIYWTDWSIDGYTGIEIWNGLSELKSVARNRWEAYFYAFFPNLIAHHPDLSALQKWDELLANGKKVVAVGGSDAHALKMHLGPIKRTIFPYNFHFRAVNTHLIVPNPLNGNLFADRRMVLDALRFGHAFVGYDLISPTSGFRFNAQGRDQQAGMGDEIPLKNGVTLNVRLPAAAECRLLHNGKVIKAFEYRDMLTHTVTQPGAYRIECYLKYMSVRRGWIFSNPIYVRA